MVAELRSAASLPPAGLDLAQDYQWDATNVSVPLGELAPGASSTLSYVTSVTTDSESPGQVDDAYNLIAYSGFGDPIRTSTGTGTDPDFPLLELTPPSFDPGTGALGGGAFMTYAPGGLPLADYDLSAPEPESWALILVGVGLAGSALRGGRSRRRVPAA